MYKIYINEKPLILADSISVKDSWYTQKRTIVVQYLGKTKQILQYMDMLSKSKKVDKVILHHTDKKALRSDFLSLVNIVEAGGGLVFNEKNQLLAIFRRGNWDLPKGKIEKNEHKRLGALREVMEETGVENVQIVKKVGKTYHIFSNKTSKRSLKLTHWYEMTTRHKGKLIPQLEEDIEKAEWVDPKKFVKNYSPMFNNISDIVDTYFKKNS